MNAEDVIRSLAIQGGSPEVKRELAKWANDQLDEGTQAERTPVEMEIDELSKSYALCFAQSRGRITGDMAEMGKRISYLKTLKAMGRATDG